MKKILLLVLSLAVLLPAVAKVRLPNVLGDHMVLQQNADVKIWGWADKGRQVTVTPSWNGKSYKVKAAADGSWMVSIPTPAGSFTPYTVAISDGDPVQLNDVLIGEVWICSGQSNMEMPLMGFTGQPVAGSLAEIVHAGAYKDRIRFTTLSRRPAEEPCDDAECKWTVCSSATVGKCSAAGYFFAKQLSDVLGLPVGLIANSWGGSAIEAWMTREMLEQVEGADIAKVSGPDRKVHQRLGQLYNGMLMPVRNCTARGILWYQGEANCDNPQIYAPMMASMVKAWRELLGVADMPFYYVEISPYRYSGNAKTESALVREAQQKALGMIPGAGMISTVDIGDELCIHPARKDVVGFRLAALALAKTYGVEGFTGTGPVFSGVSYEGGKATVTLDGAERGLFSASRDIAGFEIAGADRKFYPAGARIFRGRNIVELRSDSVAEPVAVRYAFSNYPGDVTLSDVYAQPVAPFRTDNW